jgi:hypothetical protein
MPAPKTATKTDGKTFKVALNPSNPEATSWWDQATGTNLFLAEKKNSDGQVFGPISEDLSDFTEAQLERVYHSIKSGILIVAAGELPEGFDTASIPSFAGSRMRVATDQFAQDSEEAENQARLVADLNDALSHHKSLTRKA